MFRFSLLFATMLILLIVESSSDSTVLHMEDLPALELITSDNIEQIQLLAKLEIPRATHLAWSSDSNQLLASANEGLWLIKIADMSSEFIEEAGEFPGIVRFLEHDQEIIVENRYQLSIIDLATQKIIKSIPLSDYLVGISQDGSMYATIELDEDTNTGDILAERVKVFELQNDTLLHKFPVRFYEEICNYVCGVSVSFSPNNSQITISAAVEEVESSFVELGTGTKTIMPKLGHGNVAYSPDSSFIASTNGIPGYINDRMFIIDAESAEIFKEVEFYSSSAPDFNALGDLLVIGAYDDNAPNPDESIGLVYFFDVEQLLEQDISEPIYIFGLAHPPSVVKFSPHSRLIAISEENGQLSLWGIPSNDGNSL